MCRLAALFFALGWCFTSGFAESRPNVVFILADDFGWADTTLYGHTDLYRTPNLERLARRGMVFNRAYSDSPLCSPTRSAILTGLSPARTGITAARGHLPSVALQAGAGEPSGQLMPASSCEPVNRLDTRYYTMAESFRDAGYATAHFGKWHLGEEPYSPLQHGFDFDLPHWPGPGPAGSFVAPWKYPDFTARTPFEHIEDRMADEAVAWMAAHKDQPFFLNYWQFSVHDPFDAKQALIEKYRQEIDPTSPQRSPTYAAMVESMDDAIGRLLDAIDALGLAERTIIVFYSDNGGNMYNTIDGTRPTSNLPLRGGKATVWEGGIRVPCVVAWPGLTQPGSRNDTVIQSGDFFPTFIDVLGITAPAEQPFDGVSLADPLAGKPLPPRATFTYFPHAVDVPDRLPPSVVVMFEDWKLIRIFYGARDGAHAYRLYHLGDDAGEQDDVSARRPEVVRQLDGLIEDFLRRTQAVTPVRNPDYDPRSWVDPKPRPEEPRSA